MVKYGVIEKTKFETAKGFPAVWRNKDWQEIDKEGTIYNYIISFEKYFNPVLINKLDYVFTEEEFMSWSSAPEVTPQVQIEKDIPPQGEYTRKARFTGFCPSCVWNENKVILIVEILYFDTEGIQQKQLTEKTTIAVQDIIAFSSTDIKTAITAEIAAFFPS